MKDFLSITIRRIIHARILKSVNSSSTRHRLENNTDVYIGCLTTEYGPVVTNLLLFPKSGNIFTRNFISAIAQSPNKTETEKIAVRRKDDGKIGPVNNINIKQSN